jgi:hypothetical protein
MGRLSTSTALLALAIAAALFLPAGSSLSAQGAGRTPDGHPDLQGLWLNDTATPLERPREFADKASLTDAEAREYEKRYQLDRTIAISRNKSFELDAAGDLDTYEPGRILPGGRTSMITDPPDGKVPALTPEGQRILTERTAHLDRHYAENPEDLPNAERCLTIANSAVPPLLPVFYNNTVQIVQTKDHVVIVSEMIHDARVIPLDRRTHLPPEIRLWKGDPIGHWEGDTLVVDTTNFTAKTPLRGSSSSVHIIERFRLSAPDTLAYEFTIDDPGSFVRTWSGSSAMSRTGGMVFEYACHEANYSMSNVLRGARSEEKRGR